MGRAVEKGASTLRSCFKSKVKGDERDGRTEGRMEGQLASVTNDREIEVEPPQGRGKWTEGGKWI